MEKIKARVQNPVRGGAWVSFSFCKHTALNLQQVKFFSKRQGTLARPPGNNPRRLFFICEPERAAPSSGTAAEPPHPDNPGAMRRGVGAGRKLVDLSDLWRNVKAAASFFFL